MNLLEKGPLILELTTSGGGCQGAFKHDYFLFNATIFPINLIIAFNIVSSFKVGVIFTITEASPTADRYICIIFVQFAVNQLIISIFTSKF